MTYEDAIEDHDHISIRNARAELGLHGCRIITEEAQRIYVTNDIDAPEWIACTPAAILIWLGY